MTSSEFFRYFVLGSGILGLLLMGWSAFMAWKALQRPACSACGKLLDYAFNSHTSHASLCCECVDKMGGHK